HFTGQHLAFRQHHFRFFRHLHHQAFGLGPQYRPYDPPLYTSDESSTPEIVVINPEPPRAVGCQHSQQTVTVRSENGGTREATLFRCWNNEAFAAAYAMGASITASRRPMFST